MFQSNALGILRMTRATLPLLPHDSGTSNINIGLLAGCAAYEGGYAYCAAKAAELQITHALRLELCGTRIRVSSVDVDLAETEFSRVRLKGDAECAPKALRRSESAQGGRHRRNSRVGCEPSGARQQ